MYVSALHPQTCIGHLFSVHPGPFYFVYVEINHCFFLDIYRADMNYLYFASDCRFQTASQMVRVWRNEALRVFHDRLINEDDKRLVREHVDSFYNERL